MPAFTALNVSFEIPSSSSTLASPTLPSNAAKPTRRAPAPQSLSPSIRDLPPEFLYNTFPENGVRHSSEAHEKNNDAKGQAVAAYTAPAIDFGERLTPQRSTHPDQRNCRPRSDCSVASIQAKLHTGAQKQKRKFTNRTKTGCLTCRKRKKKCDEAKPICNNCQRGNHACAGYPPPRFRGHVPTAIHPLPPRAHMLHPNTRSAATDPRVVAQMALSHLDVEQDRRLSVVPFTQRPNTEKEKMLAGHGYYQHDRELSLERDRAAMSCWLFNTLVKNGLSVEEHTRHFLDIIRAGRMPPPANEDAHTVPSQVVVEVPFHCDYGYNITIGRNVTIGRNCAFNDAGRIYIGDNSVVGPNVSIYTEERSTDPKYRQTYQSIQFGKGVMIDSDCWIGGSVTILPGKIIGKGATVMAGSVVVEDVPPFAVAAGNPACVLYSVAPL